MDTIKNIAFEIAMGTRRSKIKLLIVLTIGENIHPSIKESLESLALKTDEEVNIKLALLLEYFINNLKNQNTLL